MYIINHGGYDGSMTNLPSSTVYGVIFLFKWLSSATQGRGDAPQDGTYDPEAIESGLFFAAQTIQNACGTQAILSVIMNQDSRCTEDRGHGGIDIGSDLREFKDFTTGFPADIRGEALSNSDKIRSTHNTFARASPFVDETDRGPVSEEDSETYHFIAYTPFNGKLYELDGLQPYPISHGECAAETFPEKVMDVLQRRIGRYPDGEIRFNLMAVCRDLRLTAQEVGDVDQLQAQQVKRQNWEWENTLRRHNFVGFISEMLKGVTRQKCQQGEDAYRDWIESAKQETQRRIGVRRSLKAARQTK